ncbi:MAG: GDP-L-fucose synthase [Bauldia sp.]
MNFDLAGKRVFVAGHGGMVGAALVRRLARERCIVLTAGRNDLDLRRQAPTENWFQQEQPQVVFLAAAKVGGILANRDRPAEFLYDNLMIEANVIEAARRTGVETLVFLGSSCIYPRLAPQPIPEEALLTGPLEPTNAAYAIAKIAGIKLADAYRRQYGCRFISAQPTNLYGPGDNFDLVSSHVLPALLRKAHEAKRDGKGELEIWGSGTPKREFLHVDDLADALMLLAKTYDGMEAINIGSGDEVSIRELAGLIAEVVGFAGRLRFDASKPDGTPRKLVDSSRLAALGWQRATPLREGVRATYAWYLANAM